MKSEDKIPEWIPPALQQQAICLSYLHVAEVAWFRKDVMAIINQLKGANVAIVGGDVLRKVGDKFEYDHSSWHVDRTTEESADAYAERSLKETETYIRKFPDPDDGSVAYVLVFEKDDCNSAGYECYQLNGPDNLIIVGRGGKQ